MNEHKLLTIFVTGLISSLLALPLAAQHKNWIGEKGPLITNNSYPFYVPFINLAPENARTLGQNHGRLTLAHNYTNTFRYDMGWVIDNFIIIVDTETSRLSINYDYGLLPNLDVGLELSYTAHYGGFLDPAIQFFHSFFGFYNSGREWEENNVFRLRVEYADDAWFDAVEPLHGLGDMVLKSKIRLIDKPRAGFSLALQPAIKIPTGNSAHFISNGKMDFGLNLLLQELLFHSAIYLNIGYLYVGQPENLKLVGFINHLFSYALALELIVSSQLSLFAQIDGSTSPYIGNHFWLDRLSSTINLGFKNYLNDHFMLQVSFSEEFLTFATTDIGLELALIYEH